MQEEVKRPRAKRLPTTSPASADFDEQKVRLAMFSELGGGIAGRERTQKMRFLQAQIPRERRALHEGEYSGPSAVETGKDRAEEGPHGQFTPLYPLFS